MDLRNIILEKLCRTLTEIVIDILQFCELDPNSKDLISTNVSNIKTILELAAVSSEAEKTTEKTTKQTLSSPPTNERNLRQVVRAAKRKAEEITMIQTTKQSQKGKTRKTAKSMTVPNNESVIIHQSSAHITVPSSSEDSTDKSKEDSDFRVEDLENELIALDRTKSIFVSGFPSVTTVKAISNHVLKKLPLANIEAMDIVKLPIKGDFASFTLKTGRDDDLFNVMNSKEFWPNNTIVRRNNMSQKKFFRGQRRFQN